MRYSIDSTIGNVSPLAIKCFGSCRHNHAFLRMTHLTFIDGKSMASDRWSWGELAPNRRCLFRRHQLNPRCRIGSRLKFANFRTSLSDGVQCKVICVVRIELTFHSIAMKYNRISNHTRFLPQTSSIVLKKTTLHNSRLEGSTLINAEFNFLSPTLN